MPFYELLALEIDGQRLYQSVPICRLLATKVGLHGFTELEKFKIDIVVENIIDLHASKYSLSDEKWYPKKKKIWSNKMFDDAFIDINRNEIERLRELKIKFPKKLFL